MTAPPPAWLTVLTTTDSEEKAHELAQGAVEARLAACAQISAPVTSVYRWQNAIESSEEWQVLFKTAGSGTRSWRRTSWQRMTTRTPRSSPSPSSVAAPATSAG